MPNRATLIVLGLFAGCVAIAVLAWAFGSEFYLPPLRTRGLRPSHPLVVLVFLLLSGGFYLFSRGHGLIFFGLFWCSLVLGMFLGWSAAGWKPTLAQWSLVILMIPTILYGLDASLDDFISHIGRGKGGKDGP
jgi:hypothetical protein